MSAGEVGNGKSASDLRLAGFLLSASGLLFLLANHIAESIYPGYSVKTNFLSDLGAVGQRTTLLWDSQLFVSAILWLLGVCLLFRRSGKSRGVWALFVLAPVGQLVVSVFPENTVLALHTVGALLAFVAGGLSAVYTYRLTSSPFRYLSVLLGATSLLSFALFVSGRFLGLGAGGMERMIVYPIALWLVVIGGYVMAVEPTVSARQPSGPGK